MVLAPAPPSSPGWKTSFTVPLSSASSSLSSFAAPRSMAMWPSWPHACMTPSVCVRMLAMDRGWYGFGHASGVGRRIQLPQARVKYNACCRSSGLHRCAFKLSRSEVCALRWPNSITCDLYSEFQGTCNSTCQERQQRYLAFEVEPFRLGDWQRIHIGSQRNDRRPRAYAGNHARVSHWVPAHSLLVDQECPARPCVPPPDLSIAELSVAERLSTERMSASHQASQELLGRS